MPTVELILSLTYLVYAQETCDNILRQTITAVVCVGRRKEQERKGEFFFAFLCFCLLAKASNVLLRIYILIRTRVAVHPLTSPLCFMLTSQWTKRFNVEYLIESRIYGLCFSYRYLFDTERDIRIASFIIFIWSILDFSHRHRLISNAISESYPQYCWVYRCPIFCIRTSESYRSDCSCINMVRIEFDPLSMLSITNLRCKELSVAIRRSEAMPRLIESLPALPFEARKDVSQVSSGGW